MKLAFRFSSAVIGLSACLLFVAPQTGWSAPAPVKPKIVAVATNGNSLVFTVKVPDGMRAVTLESRRVPLKGAWVPRSVVRGKPVAPKITFQMPLSARHHAWRVRGERTSAYPLKFFAGKRAFSSRLSSLWRYDLGIGGAYMLRGDGNLAINTPLPAVPETRQVTESDIWKREGDTLYVFNQYRGLQIIDLSNPDAPVLRGELSVPDVGEQLYLIDSGHVALLAREAGVYGKSRLLIVDVSGGTPSLASSQSLDGTICESRLVGTALYVALQAQGEGVPQFGTAVVSFDLSVPAAPVQREKLWYPGANTTVMATDRFLFLALSGGWDGLSSEVKILDIASPDGAMTDAATLVTAGSVADKFKMNLSGDVFSVFSEKYEMLPEEDPMAPAGSWLTTLETFSLADATNPVPLGVLNLAPGERLHATRFDGNRAYAVTFENVDPLWVVDLSDPAVPVVAGSVEVPGWSTYIQPLGDRLVTVGVENSRASVSLFDVSDPARASLLSRVVLGSEASWSEANWDEKAFSVFSTEGLILVPFESWSNGVYASQVDLIDLGDSALTTRGSISGSLPIRRTALYRQRLLALSGKELLSVDLEDRDNPAVKGVLELSRSVNRVMASGDYLLQLEDASAWTLGGKAVLRVAAKAKPEVILNRVDLGALSVVGACVREGYFYGLQNPGLATNLLLTVLDLTALPEIHTVAQVDVPADGRGYGDFEAVWPAPDLLVWVSRSSGYWAHPMMDRVIGLTPVSQTVTADVAVSMADCIWPWWNVGGVQLLALNLKDPAHPEFVSQFRRDPGQAWGFSAPFVAQGCVYMSHEQSEQVPIKAGTTGRVAKEWRVGEFLDVIDFADPARPTARPAVSIPGQLAGLSPDGKLLYLLGAQSAYSATARESDEALSACAYDGVNAYLVGTLPLSRAWPRPVRVDDRGNVFVGHAFARPDRPPVLEAWTLSRQGVFEREATVACSAPVSEIECFGGLLAVQETTGRIALFDATDATRPTLCGESEPTSGLWAGLSRAWGSRTDGLWIPLDDYGLKTVPVK